jgi:hypothetical protein
VKIRIGALLLAALGACDGELEPAEKTRTVRVADGAPVIVGTGDTSCSHDPASSERWCAFARGTELWVFNLKQALAGAPCDGSSPHCLRITTNLWIGQPLFPPSHPSGHAFHGDTLVFYAGAPTTSLDNGYEGPIQAWRPGAGGPRVLSSDRGRVCVGHERSNGLICVDRERTVGGDLEFDLRAGTLESGVVEPLPMIDVIRPIDEDGDRMWQVAFSPDGRYFALSDRVPERTKMERLRVLESDQLGKAPLRELMQDISAWQFSPDGRQLYFLRGFNYGAGTGDAGTLTAVDFPSGANPRELQPRVGRFEVYGESGAATRVLGIYQDLRGFAGKFGLLADPNQPGQVVALGERVQDALVSPDLRHTLLIDEDEAGDLATFVARNDGSGRCRISAHPGHTVFAPTFLSSPRLLLWGEEGADNPMITEGWIGDPDSCQVGQRFSAKLAYYQTTRGGLLWGDEDESPRTMTLRHAGFSGGTVDLANATEVRRAVDTRVALIDGRYLLFTISSSVPEEAGLYLHGPMH